MTGKIDIYEKTHQNAENKQTFDVKGKNETKREQSHIQKLLGLTCDLLMTNEDLETLAQMPSIMTYLELLIAASYHEKYRSKCSSVSEIFCHREFDLRLRRKDHGHGAVGAPQS